MRVKHTFADFRWMERLFLLYADGTVGKKAFIRVINMQMIVSDEQGSDILK
jgi:hypothetical protein